jgi:hypothetical protein
MPETFKRLSGLGVNKLYGLTPEEIEIVEIS